MSTVYCFYINALGVLFLKICALSCLHVDVNAYILVILYAYAFLHKCIRRIFHQIFITCRVLLNSFYVIVDGISDIWLQIVVQRSPLVYIYLKPLCNKFWQDTRSTSNSRWRMAAILNSRSNMLLWNKILLMQVQYI